MRPPSGSPASRRRPRRRRGAGRTGGARGSSPVPPASVQPGEELPGDLARERAARHGPRARFAEDRPREGEAGHEPEERPRRDARVLHAEPPAAVLAAEVARERGAEPPRPRALDVARHRVPLERAEEREPQERGVGLHAAEHAVGDLAEEALRRLLARGERAEGQRALEVREVAAEDLAVQAVLAGEVLEEHRLGDAGVLRDGARGDAGEPVPGEEARRGGDDRFTPLAAGEASSHPVLPRGRAPTGSPTSPRGPPRGPPPDRAGE